MDYIVCHYHEIGLKGGNRRFFEEKLRKNIKRSLNAQDFVWVKRFPGRIVVKLSDEGKKNLKRVEQSLISVFGVAYFCFAKSSELDIKDIKEKALELLQKKRGTTFRIKTIRSDKGFPKTSQKVNEIIGEFILKNLDKKVKLVNPRITCFIEILPNICFLYLKKIKGAGGLPTTTAGKVAALISGGIDSPVAGYYLMKRGAQVIFIHFHSYPATNKASIEKAEELVKALTRFQFSSKLYLVPFAKIQDQILARTHEKFRVILYRRIMTKIAQEIAKREKAQALVVGDSLGQVASQTLENIGAVDEASEIPTFRPLIGEDKEEIMNLAKKIGTYDISILPHQDCCARFLPKHPETRANLREVKKAEGKLDIEKLIKDALEKIETKEFSTEFQGRTLNSGCDPEIP